MYYNISLSFSSWNHFLPNCNFTERFAQACGRFADSSFGPSTDFMKNVCNMPLDSLEICSLGGGYGGGGGGAGEQHRIHAARTASACAEWGPRALLETFGSNRSFFCCRNWPYERISANCFVKHKEILYHFDIK